MFAEPHTPVVLAPPVVQSAMVQQPPLVETHRFVPGQLRKPLLHVIPQLPPLQTAVPFEVGGVQELHATPQKDALVSGWQTPLQLCVLVGQLPLQALAFAMHAPLQSLLPVGHAGMHARPSQVTVPPPVGTWHAEQDVLSLGPQVATALLLTHWPMQTWKPLLHLRPQLPLAQAAAPFGSVGQLVQLAPHPVGSLSAAHRLELAQRWNPDAQTKSQLVPSHVVALAPSGFGHAVHAAAPAPQVSTLVFEAQIPLQLWVPAGHTPEQAVAVAMQVPAHSFIPVGQVGWQAMPSHTTVPPAGAWHAVQDVVPQLPMSWLLTQRPPQAW